jgi:hypothetical protein
MLVLQGLCFAQKSVKVVADSRTRLPLDLVYIRSENGKLTLLTNGKGHFILPAGSGAGSFLFYRIGYIKLVLTESELLKTDTLFLSEAPLPLDTLEISASAIETVVKNARFYVNDYLLLPNNDVLLITSKINIKGFELMYYKRNRGITQIRKLKGEHNEGFYTDCFKNIHLITSSYSRQIFFDSDSSFDFLPKYSRARFDSTLIHCALKLDSQVIVRQSPPPVRMQGGYMQNSSFIHYILCSKHESRSFYTVFYNERLMEMLKYEMADDFMMNMSKQAKETLHEQFYSKIARPIYAPLFLKNDTVLVFNFNAHEIVWLNNNATVLRKVTMNGVPENANFQVIYDVQQSCFYLKTYQSGKEKLQRINIYTGEAGKEIKLQKTFAKNVQVKNGRIYYLVKEQDWDDTCYLYQQN